MKMINFKYIQTKLIVSIIFFMVIPMAILSLFTARSTEKVVSKKIEALTMNTLEQLNANFQQVLDNMLVISNVVEMDRDFTKLLTDENNENEYEEYLRRQKIIDKMTSYLGIMLRYNCQIALVDNNDNFYTTWNRRSDYRVNNDIIGSQWYKDTIEFMGKVRWVIPQDSYIPDEKNTDKRFITMSRLVKGDKSFGRYGVLIVSLYIDELETNLNQNALSDTEGFFIMNQSGEIVSKTSLAEKENITDLDWCYEKMQGQDQGSFIETHKGKKMQVIFKNLKHAGLKTVYITPYNDIQKELSELQNRNILLIIALMLSFILITVFISFTISKPIKLLTRHMRNIKDGKLDVQVIVNSRDEVGQLTENFNYMLQDLKKLMSQIQQKEKEKKEAHLIALQAQINPHFLFNTLNAIKWAAYVNGVPNVGDMVAALGRLFEIVINKNSEFITIKEEMEYLNNYIVLMGFKNNQEISVEYSVDDSIKNLYTLKFILQPIVENSIIHGFGENVLDGKLTISGQTQNQSVIIKITDNGKGMSEEKIKALLQLETNSHKRRFSGIGISNVNERIKMNFGDIYGIEINSSENSGTTVFIKVPVINNISEEVAEKNDQGTDS